MTYREAMRKAARDYLVGMIDSADGNIAEAARRAGLNRQDFYKKLARVGIRRSRGFGNESWRALDS